MNAAGPTLSGELRRKAIHLATAALPVAWSYDILSGTALRWALGLAVPIALGVEWARARGGPFREAFLARFGPLLRRHESSRLTGATWLAIAMWGAVMLAPRGAAIAALWSGTVGDAVAAVVGRLVQRARGGAGKSLAGSLALILATAAGIHWLVDTPMHVALALGSLAALAERPVGPGDDNLRVTLGVAAGATLLGLR